MWDNLLYTLAEELMHCGRSLVCAIHPCFSHRRVRLCSWFMSLTCLQMLSFYVLKSTHAESFHYSLFSKEYIFEKMHTVIIIHNTDIALTLLIYVGLVHPCFIILFTVSWRFMICWSILYNCRVVQSATVQLHYKHLRGHVNAHHNRILQYHLSNFANVCMLSACMYILPDRTA